MRINFITLILIVSLLNSCTQRLSAQNAKLQEPATSQDHSEFSQNPAPKAEISAMTKIQYALQILPEEVRQKSELAISTDTERFLFLLNEAEKESKLAGDLLILVDKKNYLPELYEPEDLVSLNDYPLSRSRNDLRLRACIMDRVLEMNTSALQEGISLVFSSSYRSYSYQDGLFSRYSKNYGVAEAERFSARPGTSQHQLGTAIDFGSISDDYAETKAGKWLNKNAWKYGFSLSFPQDMEAVTGYIWECWHFRYITKAGCIIQREYFDDVQQYFLEFLNEYRKVLQAD